MFNEKSDDEFQHAGLHSRVDSDNTLGRIRTAHSTNDAATLAPAITQAEHMSRQWTCKSRFQVEVEAVALCRDCVRLEDFDREVENFKRGAELAWLKDQHPAEIRPQVTVEEKDWLQLESSSSLVDNFHIPWAMWLTAILCGLSAVVQGMDQSAVNGAQVGYATAFHIHNRWIDGLVNAAPYICCALLGCWTAPTLNKWTGRKGTIGISCVFAILSGIWQMCTQSTWELFASRFIMGFAIGAKSSTTPAYAAECAPAKIRGAIGTQWQMWTAFGIMLGLVVDVAFMDLHTSVWGETSGWRIILGSTAVPPVVVIFLLIFVPESPRWYIINKKYRKAYRSLCRLRNCRLQAARDIYDIDTTFKHEGQWRAQQEDGFLKRNTKLFSVPRNRRGAQSAAFLMFMQQMCGVNVIAYYSTQIFKDAGFNLKNALLFSLGAGIINFVMAIPGTITIDKRGRRPLLLVTFPLMSICLIFTGCGFYAGDDQVKLGVVGAGIMLFMVFYSPGMGPVPFTYSAEAYPLEVRDIGMSFATAVCWGFNAILALTFPPMSEAFGRGGAFFFYAAWNIFGLIYTYFYLPETKKLPLEMIDRRFQVSLRQFGRLNYYRLPWKRNIELPRDLDEIRDTMTREFDDPETDVSHDRRGVRQYFCCHRRIKADSPTSTLVASVVNSNETDDMNDKDGIRANERHFSRSTMSTAVSTNGGDQFRHGSVHVDPTLHQQLPHVDHPSPIAKNI